MKTVPPYKFIRQNIILPVYLFFSDKIFYIVDISLETDLYSSNKGKRYKDWNICLVDTNISI